MNSSSPRPRVDVAVITWNSAELTAKALRHLLDTDQGADLRVLVHDNASSDGTAARIRAEVPEAEVVEGDANLGFAKALNLLFERSSAPWFFALNSDAWPEPGAIGRLVASAQSHPEAAAIAPLVLRPEGGLEYSTQPFPSLKLAALDLVGGRRWLPPARLDELLLEGGWDHDRPRDVDWAVWAALLLRRSAFIEIGGLDERFFMYVEDLEWGWRARAAGWTTHFEPAAVVRHVGNASGERRFGQRRIGLEAANLRIFLSEAFGRRRALLYRGLQAAVAGVNGLVARTRGEIHESQYWKLQAKAYLALVPPPLVGLAEPPVVERAPDAPRVSVVVPSRNRSERLATLLGCLEAQTLPKDQFEVLVVDDGSTDDTPEVLRRLRESSDLQLSVMRQEQCTGPAAARNRAWRVARAPVIAFTDDDCRPEPGWLAAGLAAMGDEARVVVGRTAPPPDQVPLGAAPFSRVMQVDSATLFETCNVFYRHQDLELVGGFDERFRRPSGEDIHLGMYVIRGDVEPVFAPEAIVYHDVRPGDFTATWREVFRWADLPLVVKDRPEIRFLGHRLVFWNRSHPPALVALVGLALSLRWKFALVLVLPWLRFRLVTTPICEDPVLRVRTLPGAFAIDVAEIAVMVQGSIRHKTFLL